MAHRGRSPGGGVFGYNFGQEDLQPPDSASSGESLLTATEQMGLGQFFKNPDDSAMDASHMGQGLNFGSDNSMNGLHNMFNNIPQAHGQRPQQWSADQQIASYNHLHGFRPQSAQQAHVRNHNHNHMVMDHALGNNLDESGHMGANALFSLAQNPNPTERALSQRRYSEYSISQHMRPANHGPPVLGAMSYSAAPIAGPDVAHVSHIPSFTDTNVGRSNPNTPIEGRGREISLALQFDTDASFTSSGHTSRGHPSAGFESPSGDHYMSGMVYPGYPAARHSNAGLGRNPQFGRTSSDSKTIKQEQTDVSSAEAQAMKRRRTMSFPAQISTLPDAIDSSPTLQTTKMDISNSPAPSNASSPSGSNSDAVDVKGAGGRRRGSTNTAANAAAAAAAAAANSKRLKLSDKQRKENHIQSEKRRRAEMKKGYDALDKLVPSLKSGGLSKAQILQQTVVFLESLVAGNKKAEQELALRSGGSGMPPAAPSGGWGLTTAS